MKRYQPNHWLAQKIRMQKQKKKIIQVDMKEYYPSITKKALDKVISFTSNHPAVSLEDICIIKHSRKSSIFHLE